MEWEDSGLLPVGIASQVLTAAQQQSAVMSLAAVRPMPAYEERVPLVTTQPTPQWIDVGEKKPYGEVEWSAAELIARELAVLTAIPDSYLADSSFDAEGSVQSEFASAFARALDRAILFGTDAPPGFPTLVEGAPAAGADALEAIDQAMTQVESSGVQVTGIVAGPQIGSALRQAYRQVQALPSTSVEPNVYGAPVRIVPDWPPSAGFDAIVGSWSYLLVGVRQDVRYERSTEGVLTNDDGSIRVSAFESDMTLVRAHARYAAAVGRPVGPSGPIVPFAAASWSTQPPAPEPATPEPAT